MMSESESGRVAAPDVFKHAQRSEACVKQGTGFALHQIGNGNGAKRNPRFPDDVPAAVDQVLALYEHVSLGLD